MMDFKQYIIAEVREIKNFVNTLIANAKKIPELPEQTTFDPNSLLHVSREGNSEKLPVSRIIEAVERNIENRLIECGDITISSNSLTVQPNISAVINSVIYTRSTSQVLTIPFADTGKNRTDLIVFNTAGNLVRVIGEETIGIAVRPVVPIDTVLVTEVSVNDADISNTDPIYSTIDTTANHFKGNYDITTNLPVLSDSTGILNDEYRCSAAGTRDFGSGNITVGIGDILSFNGATWFRKVNNNQSADLSSKQDTLTETNFGAFSNSLTTEDAIVDGDKLTYTDDSDSNKQKKTSWSNIKAVLKNYFDSLYQSVLVSGTNIKTIGGTSILGSGDIPISGGGGTQDLDDILGNGFISNFPIVLNAVTNVPKTIVWIGDSIIQGTGPTTLANRYSTLTCTALNYTEDNRAISGSTLTGASFTLIPTKTSTLQYLVIGYGTNDIAAGRTSTQFQTDLTNFVDNAISKGWAGSDIVIVSLPGYQYQSGSGSSTKVAFNTAMSNVATTKGCTYVDFYNSMITNTPFGPVSNLFLTTDGTHPNDLGSIAHATIIKSVFEVKFNITTQQFIANGDTELTAVKLKEFEYSKTARFLGVENDGKMVPLIGIPENTVAMGKLYLNKNIIQSEAIVPSASGANDFILKIDSKIIAAYNNTLYGEFTPYGSDGHSTFRNRYAAGNYKFYISPSTGAQALAMDIQAPSGIVKCNFGIAIPYGGGFIEQRADASNHGRFHLFTDAGDTELNNAFNTGKYKLFMSNGTAGGKVQMLQTFASGRTQLQNGGTYTDLPSARLAINSTTEGFLVPRMTTAQRDAISSPAEGLEIYNLTTHQKNYWNGTSWIAY